MLISNMQKHEITFSIYNKIKLGILILAILKLRGPIKQVKVVKNTITQ